MGAWPRPSPSCEGSGVGGSRGGSRTRCSLVMSQEWKPFHSPAERVTGIEPAVSSLATRFSTLEKHPQKTSACCCCKTPRGLETPGAGGENRTLGSLFTKEGPRHEVASIGPTGVALIPLGGASPSGGSRGGNRTPTQLSLGRLTADCPAFRRPWNEFGQGEAPGLASREPHPSHRTKERIATSQSRPLEPPSMRLGSITLRLLHPCGAMPRSKSCQVFNEQATPCGRTQMRRRESNPHSQGQNLLSCR